MHRILTHYGLFGDSSQIYFLIWLFDGLKGAFGWVLATKEYRAVVFPLLLLLLLQSFATFSQGTKFAWRQKSHDS